MINNKPVNPAHDSDVQSLPFGLSYPPIPLSIFSPKDGIDLFRLHVK